MADASMCAEVPTQEDTLPGFLRHIRSLVEAGVLQSPGVQLKRTGKHLLTILTVSELRNATMRYTGRERDPEVPKINTKGQRPMLTVEEIAEQTKVTLAHFLTSLSSVTNLPSPIHPSPFLHHLYVKLSCQN